MSSSSAELISSLEGNGCHKIYEAAKAGDEQRLQAILDAGNCIDIYQIRQRDYSAVTRLAAENNQAAVSLVGLSFKGSLRAQPLVDLKNGPSTSRLSIRIFLALKIRLPTLKTLQFYLPRRISTLLKLTQKLQLKLLLVSLLQQRAGTELKQANQGN